MTIFDRKNAICGWRAVHVTCEPGFEDILSAVIFESGFSGLEEHTYNGKPLLKAFFRIPDNPPSPLEIILKKFEEPLYKNILSKIVSEEDVLCEDWEKSWREGLKAVEIGKKLVVRPSWVNYVNSGNRIEIIIDPKMAFGTGGHATTSLCLEALEKIDLKGKTVFDAGCGSGVLSIAAAKLGAEKVTGIDNDSFSVENAIENAGLNGVANKVEIAETNLEKIETGQFDIILANIIYKSLVSNLKKFRAILKPNGTAVFSGLLNTEEELFCSELARENFKIKEITRKDEWIAVVCGI